MGMDSHIIYPATLRPDDVSSVLIPDGKGDVFSYVSEPALRAVQQKSTDTVLFIDEMSGAYAAVQGALMNVILQRRVGDIRLSPRIRMIAAANPPEYAANGWELEPPNANRFCHFEVNPPEKSSWYSWLKNRKETKRVQQVEMVDAGVWEVEYAKQVALVELFTSAYPDMYYALPKVGSTNIGRAWPSLRTWTFAIHALTTIACLNAPPELNVLFVQGCVGNAAAVAFMNFIRNMDLPTPIDVLSGKWKHKKNKGDIAYIALSNTLQYVLNTPNADKRKDMCEEFLPVLLDVAEMGDIDLVIPTLRMLLTRGNMKYTTSSAKGKVLMKKVLDIFNKLGLTVEEENRLMG
jgi:hypothetical protein